MGEKSKKSGEIGEKISSELLRLIGWKNALHNMSITCNSPKHRNESGNQRETHGEDQLFIYHNPFHDDRTEIVHVSVKNSLGAPPGEATLRTKFKSHFKECQEIIECAKHSPEVNSISRAHTTRGKKSHSGLLIWLHNDESDIECDIKPHLASSRLESDAKFPIYLIDNARASFLIKIIDDIKRKSEDKKIEFFYPRIGTSVYVNEARSGSSLPLELIASDVVPFLVKSDDSCEMVIYADQKFSVDAYKKLLSYALQFSSGLVAKIKIGMPDYNPSQDEHEAQLARFHFPDRNEEIIPFSFNRSILSLIPKED
ncbi:hypothetical protein SAMN05216214_11346 [Atopomonas hussainii]|uniref:GAPS4 PD-(D/E)XK nuclease domain-containing protein n=1 Tax=Atopomonas hussainii TaxID=1429083 RepID=A0A1H7QS52_9GAMM|nr:hypothetical protein [Atopomonas hussainii]SEL50548.1 hypothetical protein SAMN05216214_11346 [Atopomonas hussainii]